MDVLWAFLPLLIVGGLGYFIYVVVRPEPVLDSPGGTSDQRDSGELYKVVAEELRTNSLKQPLWLRAFAEADADEPRARAAYIRYRVAELQAAHPTDLRPAATTSEVAGRPTPPWKRTARRVLLLFTWMMLVTGVIAVLLSAYVQDSESAQPARLAGQGGLYAILGVSILSAVRARRRKALWFFVGGICALIAVMAATAVIIFIRHAFE